MTYTGKSLVLAATLAATLVGAGGEAFAQQAQCDNYARNYASSTVRGQDVAGGAIAGAIGGALIGGIAGGGRGAGTGALIGTGVGAVGGAVNNEARWRQVYWAAYNDCMSRSAPAPAYYGGGGGGGYAPEPWTQEWYNYCRSKYRSFNPQTGKYLASSGQYKMCR
ncbi:MAG: BA14K family protein [Hyphomicrobiales bacterium]